MRKYINYLAGALVAVMFLVIFVQITARLILKVPTSWSVEIGIILFLFVVFLGIASTTRERSHLRVDALHAIMPPWLRRIVDIACGLAYIAFFAAFAWGAYINAVDNWRVEIPTVEWFRWGYVYLVILLATLVNIWHLCVNLVEDAWGMGDKP